MRQPYIRFMFNRIFSSRVRQTILVIIQLFSCCSLLAQNKKFPAATNVARQEFDAQDGYVNEKVTQMEQDGLLMSSRSVKAVDGEWQFRYSVFNTNLEEVKQIELPVNKVNIGLLMSTQTVLGTTHFHQFIFGKKHYVLHSIPRVGQIKPIEIEGDFPMSGQIQSIAVVQQKLVVSVKTKAGVSLLFIDWKTGDVDKSDLTLPAGVKAKQVSIMNLQALTNTNEIAVTIKIRSKKGPTQNLCVIHSGSGSALRTLDITPQSDILLMEVRVTAVAGNKYIFAGTYTNNVKSKSNYTAQGVFFAESDANQLKFMTATNFLDLKNFLDFLPQKTQDKIEKRQERAESKGKELAYNYSMTIHPIAVANDGYFLVGEAFYPVYHTETIYVNGKPQTRRVFDGYQYTHAIVVKFNLQGNRVMDQCLGMYLVDLPMYVVQNISLNVTVPNQIALSYANDKYLVSKIFNHAGTEISQKQYEVIGTGNEDERIRQSTATLRHWYGPNFVAYGFQVIKKSGSGKRRVFYINKLQIGS